MIENPLSYLQQDSDTKCWILYMETTALKGNVNNIYNKLIKKD